MTYAAISALPAAGAAALVLALGLAASPAMAQDPIPDQTEAVAALGADLKKGKKVFRKCKACHVADEAKNRVGPHLMHLLGRPAAIVADFDYSDANKESGIIWTVETLTEYLKDPRGYLEGTKMVFAGLKKDDDIANVIGYIFEEGGGVYEAPAN